MSRAGLAKMAALIGLLVAAPASWGLGLGEIELESSLNEKLDAQIELLDAQGLQPTEVIVSLASADDFERVGVERFFFLTDLRFEVDLAGGAVRHINVTSTQPVTEPYLNFLVEVLWPNGRLLKEFTLLLDPPTFSPAPAPTVSAPAQSRQGAGGAGRVERPVSSATASRGTNVQLAPGRQTTPSPLDEGVVDGEYRMTDRSDTLWTIAARTRPSQAVTVQQNMLAIQRLNPQAFLNDNINLLKAGYSLKLPTEQQALALAVGEANQQVAMQNEDWRALQRGEPVPSRGEQPMVAESAVKGVSEPALQAQVDATPTRPAAERPQAPTDGELRIVAGAGDSATGAVEASAEQINAALEEQDRLGREVQALTDELDREREIASNQIAVKDRQLEVKDQQIAEMQAEMERLRQEMQQLQAAAQSQNQSASGTVAWWQSPIVLGGAAFVVVLLLGYALVTARRRKAREEEDDFYSEIADDDTRVMSSPAPAAAAVAAATVPDFDRDEELQAATAKPAPAFGQPEPPAAVADGDAASDAGDVIGEADIYIAYGRYPQAIGLLLGVLEEDPDRNDVRLKLLELYAETRDRDAFDTHMAELLERCDDDEALLTARELGAQFGEGGDDATVVQAAQQKPAPDLASGQADGDDAAGEALELEDLQVPGMTGAADQTPGAEDFELELDELTSENGGAHTRPAGDDLGGDLGIDFDPEHVGNGSSHAQAESATADDLDLDLDLEDAGVLGDDAFDFEDEGDTASTKLDLARAYIDMGDQDGARDILKEVVAEGSPEQQQRANAMLEEL